MLWPGLANGLPEVGLVLWGSSLFCVGGENDVSSAIIEKALFGCTSRLCAVVTQHVLNIFNRSVTSHKQYACP